MIAAYQISPSVLAPTPVRFSARVKSVLALTPRIHIDIMDGDFVRTRSISARRLARTHLPPTTAVHLMVAHPLEWLSAVRATGARRVIIHIENGQEAHLAIAAFRSAGIEVGLGLKVTTPLRRLRAFGRVTWIHAANGRIGYNGSPLQPRALTRLRQLHQQFPRAHLSCDVGVNPTTLPALVRAGARELVIGSYLQGGQAREKWAILQAQQRQL